MSMEIISEGENFATSRNPEACCYFLVRGGGGRFKRFFFGMTKIKEVKNWYCSLEMKENFGMRPLVAAS